MRYRTEKILLLESRPNINNWYAAALAMLGYTDVTYVYYTRRPPLPLPPAADPVVAVWADGGVAIERFAEAVGDATARAGVRGALIISPFATEANARLLVDHGAKAWVRPPASKGEIGARLNVMLYGDRRRTVRPVAVDRRHAPIYATAIPA